MKCDDLFKSIDALNEKYLRVWEEASNIESPTSYKAGVDEAGKLFIRMAKERNWKIEVLECENAGNAVCITMNGHVQNAPIVFSGHIDTVHPVGLFGSPAVKKDNEKIYGPGVTDCKGGVVASFMAMEALEQIGFNKRPVKLIIQSDEETGSKNSNKKTVEFMKDKAKDAIAFLNTEPTDDNVAVIQRKGIARYRFNVKGVAAHSARCTEGASAVLEAAYKIIALEKYKDIDNITCNCGVISGGTTPNTVAEECSFLADIRYKDNEQLKDVKKAVREIAQMCTVKGCTCILEEVSFRPAMPRVKRNEELLKKMNEIYLENGKPVLKGIIGQGGSDAAYMTEAEIPCIDSIGVYGGYIHSVNEFAYISSLKESAKRLASVAYCI